MTTNELKEFIFRNQKIEYLLESLGCHHIQYNERHEYYSAAFPDGDNPQGINIRNNTYLNFRSFSRNVSFDDRKDIFDLVQYITDCDFTEAFKYLCSLLDLKYTGISKQKPIEKKEHLAVFKRVKKKNVTCDVQDIQYIEENVLEDYVPLLHVDWFHEGIMPWTRDKFGIMFSYERSRVIIPMRHWKTGKLMGTNARTTIPNYDLYGIKKYFITPSYQKQFNVYGMFENRKSIEEKKYVVVVEAEKSVLKRDSLFDGTLVALSGHSMSRSQYGIICTLAINEVVIAMDKDVPIEEVWHMCELFYMKRAVSFIYDSWGVLADKDSPADADNDTYQFLFDNRTLYDEVFHQKYLSYMNEFKGKKK